MKKLSIIIPCYNEENNLEEILKRVKSVKINNLIKEIIVIDDCSIDNSRKILEKNKDKIQKIIYNSKNMGKGAAIRIGIEKATGDFVIIQDADLEYNPEEYKKMVQALIDNKSDAVYGSRFKNKQKSKGYYSNIVANKVLTKMSNMFTKYDLTDMETCYKLIKKDVIDNIKLEENRFGFEPEITAKLSKVKAKIVEVPIEYNPRTKEEGKKIGIKDGIRAIYCIWKYR